MESELMEAGGTIDEAGSRGWSSICLWGNGPQERLVFLPHTVQTSESNMDALDDSGACAHTRAQVHVCSYKHTQMQRGKG